LHFDDAFFGEQAGNNFYVMIYRGMIQNLKTGSHRAAFLFGATVN
jgi:hypothetical protein